jgi:hypothetical protein
MSYIVFVVRFLFAFAFSFGRRRWRDARSGRFPNEPAPFIRFAEQLKGSERVAGMTLDTKYLCDHL